jgi:hypothetical protein
MTKMVTTQRHTQATNQAARRTLLHPQQTPENLFLRQLLRGDGEATWQERIKKSGGRLVMAFLLSVGDENGSGVVTYITDRWGS